MKERFTTSLFTGALLLASAGPLAAENEWSVDWHSIDSGGVLHTETADEQWRLSGTIGQWDASEGRALAGDGWQLTGGFWGITLDELSEKLFDDRFESGQD